MIAYFLKNIIKFYFIYLKIKLNPKLGLKPTLLLILSNERLKIRNRLLRLQYQISIEQLKSFNFQK